MIDAPFTPPDPLDEPTIREVPEWQTAVARYDDVTMADIRTIMDAGFGAVGQVLQSHGLQPVGGAFAKYEGDPSQTFSIEIGFPVAEALDEPVHVGDVVVIPSSLPAGRIVTVSHVGGYDGLGEAWGDARAAARIRPRRGVLGGLRDRADARRRPGRDAHRPRAAAAALTALRHRARMSVVRGAMSP